MTTAGPTSIMQAVKLATGVTPTCWRPPFGDVDDRIRAIAAGLGLRTILWQYDSQDWQVGTTPGVTPQSVDQEYQTMISDAKKGMFNQTGTMILMHELNDFTMSQAIKYYPKVKAVFDHIVPVGVGMNITHPYVEDGYDMPNFVQYIAGMGSEYAKNGTNSTLSAMNKTSTTQNTSGAGTAAGPSGTSGSTGTTRKSAATRLGDWPSTGGLSHIVGAFVVGFACAAGLGLSPAIFTHNLYDTSDSLFYEILRTNVVVRVS
ncbi:hypothetical protein D9619_008478 [Psilocybe cf. subviscida]|uniref:chitin deacetylase n=1 Tax=Psilocybe cf. subviscida TaxID=2480587 RepID=A0A8H5F0V6_9AGAR|nr:hypothetical protein D9619_008478 [Psilocybe cf. subviscida]